jgi:hypothetical protein
MRVFFVLAFFVILVLAACPCWGGIPNMINYQGMLTDDGGTPLDGTYNLSFKIYGSKSGPDSVWWEHHTGVTVSDGLFSVMLGSISSLSYSVFNDTIRYLGISVDFGAELSPRTRLTSVSYAYRSLWSDSAAYTVVGAENDSDWTISGNNMYSAVSGSVGIGTDNPSTKLNVVGGAFLVLTSAIGGSGCRIDGNTITGTGVNTPGSNPLHIKPGDNSSYVLLAEDGGNVGIGTDEPWSKLHIHEAGVGQPAYAQFTNDNTQTMPTDGFFVGINSSGNAYLSNHEYQSLTIQTNNADRMHITSDGRVGIGTTNPQGALDVSSTTGAFIVPRMTTTQRDALTAVNGMIIYNTTNNKFNFYENGVWETKPNE